MEHTLILLGLAFLLGIYAGFGIRLLWDVRKSGPGESVNVKQTEYRTETINCFVDVSNEEIMLTDEKVLGDRIRQRLRENIVSGVWRYVQVHKIHNPQLMKTRFRASLTVVDRESGR